MDGNTLANAPPRGFRATVGGLLLWGFLIALVSFVIWPWLHSTFTIVQPRAPSFFLWTWAGLHFLAQNFHFWWWVLLLPAGLTIALGRRGAQLVTRALSWPIGLWLGALIALFVLENLLTGAVALNSFVGIWPPEDIFRGSDAVYDCNKLTPAEYLPLVCLSPVTTSARNFIWFAMFVTCVFALLWIAARNGVSFDAIFGEMDFGRKPATSGNHGTAELAKPDAVAAAALSGNKWGEGFRLPNDKNGNPMRYIGGVDGKGQPNSIAVIGPPRCGKFATFSAALTLEYQGSMVIIDPKGEHLAVTLRERKKRGPVKILCGLRTGIDARVLKIIDEHFQQQETTRRTDSYNILDDLDPESDTFEIDCDKLAGTLIKAVVNGDDFWNGNAKNAVSGVIMHLKKYAPDEANVPRVFEIISSEKIFAVAKLAKDKFRDKYVLARLEKFSAEGAATNQQLRSFLSTANQQLMFVSGRAMENMMRTPVEPWNFRDLKDGDKPMTIYIVSPSTYTEELGRFNRLLISGICREMLNSGPGKHHVAILADEFPLMGRVEEFLTIFSMGGGSGVSMIPIAQTEAQMTKIWGDEGWQEIRTGCDVLLTFPPRTEEAAKLISARAGQRTIVKESRSYGQRNFRQPSTWFGASSRSESEMGQPVLDPHELKDLSDRCLINMRGMSDTIEGFTQFYLNDPELRERADPNPWHAKKT